MRKAIICILIFCLGGAAWLTAQEARKNTSEKPGLENNREQATVEPSEPEILLPEVLIEIEDLSVENVKAALPEESEYSAPELKLPLPEEELLVIPAEAFDLILAETDEEVGGTSGPARELGDFYSEGTIGGGSTTHVLGSIALYKLGSDLRFRLHFSHEGLDGYNFHKAGEGFFNRQENLDGSLSLTLDKLNLTAAAAYLEEEEGFQGRSLLYNSVINRFGSGDSTFLYSPLDWLVLQTQVESTFVNRILAGSTSENVSEIWVQPALSTLFSFPLVSIGLTGTYGFRNLIGYDDFLTHKWGVALSFDTNFDLDFALKGDVGLTGYVNDGLHVPFSVSLSASFPQSNLAFELTGGYKVADQTFFQLWKEIPMLAIEEGFKARKSWFGRLGVQWKMSEGFTIQGGANLERSYDEVLLLPDRDIQTGLLPYGVSSLLRITPHAGFSWDWRNTLNINFDYYLQAYEKQPYEPVMQFSLDAELRSPEGSYGVNFQSDWNIFYGAEVPKLGAGAFLRITEGVVFNLEVEDFLAPLLNVTRLRWGDTYEDKGFLVTLKALISL